MVLRTLMLLMAAGMAGGCTSPVELTDATTPLRPDDYTVIGDAHGRSMGFSLLLFEFGATDSVGAARDEAIVEAGANALVEVSVDQTDFYFFNVFGFHWTNVYGTAVRTAR